MAERGKGRVQCSGCGSGWPSGDWGLEIGNSKGGVSRNNYLSSLKGRPGAETSRAGDLVQERKVSGGERKSYVQLAYRAEAKGGVFGKQSPRYSDKTLEGQKK